VILITRLISRYDCATMHTSEHAEHFIVPIGPQHPALKEPGHFEFTVEGETVIDATVRLGYVHRGIEKAVETRNWVQNLYLLERVCGICSHCHALAYALGVEHLAGVSAPPRAQAIRMILAELERVHSHLLWLGVAAHEAGFETLFMYAWRDRETVMDLLEKISGSRVHYSANILGGVKFDIDTEQADSIKRGIDYLEERTRYYLGVISSDATFLRRTVASASLLGWLQKDWAWLARPPGHRVSHGISGARLPILVTPIFRPKLS